MSGHRTERLRGFLLLDIAVLPETPKNVLDNLCLLGSRCPAKDIKVDSEPVVDTLVNGMVLSTELRGLYAFLECLCLCGGSIFILRQYQYSASNFEMGRMTNRTANKQRLVASCLAEASKSVCRQDTPHHISEMRDIIHVWQSTSDENIALTLYGENGIAVRHDQRSQIGLSLISRQR